MTSHQANHHHDAPARADSPRESTGHASHDEAGGGHAHHTDHTGHAEMFRHLFWITLALSVPVIALSSSVEGWFGYDLPGSAWIPPTLGVVVFIVGGRPFLTMARDELSQRSPAMMTLISLAIVTAFAASAAATLGIGEMDFWWELAGLIVVMLLGHWQEMRAVGQAQGALAALAELLPDTAERVVDAEADGDANTGGGDPAPRTDTVPIADLVKGDVVLVRPGGRVPADGDIRSGEASMDESMITGESAPVRRRAGEHVVAGTVATDGSLRVEVTDVGEDTALAGIQRMVADAQESHTGTRRLADRAAAWLFYIALSAAILTLAVHVAIGEPTVGVTRAVTVLVIACPHALGLAIPLVVAISTSTAAKQGLLIKSLASLEQMRTIDTVLFDKTGTLTHGSHEVTEVALAQGEDRQRVVSLAAAVETDSEHPIGRAVVALAERENVAVRQAADVTTLPGVGVEGQVDGKKVAVGGPALMETSAVQVDDELARIAQQWSDKGGAVLYVVIDGALAGIFTTSDPVRTESRAAVSALKAEGIEVVLLTGDAQAVADAVAGELGIDRVYAQVKPDDKDQVVGELQREGKSVAMVGDGVNDAPALARADVGLAIGAGTDVAMEAADVVLATSDPRAVVSAVALSHATYRKMIQNLVWATAYNAVAVPVAAGVFSWAGITMPPAAAALAMSASTIVVALNAQLLRRVDLDPDNVIDREPAAPSPKKADALA
ncbi:heavy metal translocating P-type ATPase [Demequina sp. TTPB684]|uniref:heavy metal translocating P-type ATPase n=1 Tax=unclassified Demequina TaxID=2620311 RepID=UPI001CF41A5E|nr:MULTISPECIES: heavy metal translocating P-type ATPase [unclassified Demequina]MCB2413278.1 heavy metal translocating P-type ATPase [Demequina sp. TTPB684]UPU88738.1 heavy metal translocating P-type ATPase [Demequina sp. TMPB413]